MNRRESSVGGLVAEEMEDAAYRLNAALTPSHMTARANLILSTTDPHTFILEWLFSLETTSAA